MTIFVSEKTSTWLLGMRALHGLMAQGSLPSNQPHREREAAIKGIQMFTEMLERNKEK
jgi:hypothetical protein